MNAVVTTLLCSAPDPQRGERWDPDGRLLDTLAGSITGADLTVLHDTPLRHPVPAASYRAVPPSANPYHHRWAVIADWLATCEAEWVWCVDATDVEMLHEPWGHMEEGVIYCGSEPSTEVAEEWLAENHPSAGGSAGPLLNAGLLGGYRATVRQFCAVMLSELALSGDDLTDMAAFNRTLAFDAWPVVTGPQVHTRFRAEERDHPTAWWRHK